MSTHIEPMNEANRRIVNEMVSTRRMPRILVAEDDAEMRRLLVRNLRKAGFDVIECVDGWDLLDHLGNPVYPEDSDDFDLIVSDIRMPGVTGLEILEGIHDNEWFVPMILITAFGSDEVHKEVEDLGAAGIFDKPFDIDELIKGIREALVLDSPLGHNWQPQVLDVDAEATIPVDVVFDRMEPIDHIRQKVQESAEIFSDIQNKVLYCRAVITGPSPGRPERYYIQIMVTLNNKVFVVRSNLKSISSEAELSVAIPKAFEVTMGRIRKFLVDRVN